MVILLRVVGGDSDGGEPIEANVADCLFCSAAFSLSALTLSEITLFLLTKRLKNTVVRRVL